MIDDILELAVDIGADRLEAVLNGLGNVNHHSKRSGRKRRKYLLGRNERNHYV